MIHRIKSLAVVKERQKRYAVTVQLLSNILYNISDCSNTIPFLANFVHLSEQ